MAVYQHRKTNLYRRKGQSLVEFALVLPFLIALVMGIIEFGWLTKNQLTINNAAREGARTAALGRPTSEITSTIQNQAETVPGVPGKLTITMKCDDNNAANGYVYSTDLGNITEDGVTKNDAPAGAMIEVVVSIPNQTLTGFFPYLQNRPIIATVVMRRES